jgi:hypothetical protein
MAKAVDPFGSRKRPRGADPVLSGVDRQRLLDDLICPRDDRLRNGEAECLSGSEVDHEVEFSRLFNGQVGGLCPFRILAT